MLQKGTEEQEVEKLCLSLQFCSTRPFPPIGSPTAYLSKSLEFTTAVDDWWARGGLSVYSLPCIIVFRKQHVSKLASSTWHYLLLAGSLGNTHWLQAKELHFQSVNLEGCSDPQSSWAYCDPHPLLLNWATASWKTKAQESKKNIKSIEALRGPCSNTSKLNLPAR